MPLTGPPSVPGRNHDEIPPDIVFIISTLPDGSNPLGYFCSSGAQPFSVGWLSFAANTDTWVWFTNPPAPPPPPPAPPQYGDTAWPGTFYLLPQATTWTPPAAPASGVVTTAYSSAGNWTGTATPTSDPSWLVAVCTTTPAKTTNVAYVQRVLGTRTWFKSGTVLGQDSWSGAYIPVGSGAYLKLSQPSSPGTTSARYALVTTKIA